MNHSDHSHIVPVESTGRVRYFDYLRGLAIIMVVGIHSYPGHLKVESFNLQALTVIIRNFFNCAVPLFLAISGYFIAKRDLNTLAKCNLFWRKQIPTVYIPCLVFSLPWFLLSWKSTGYAQGGVIRLLFDYFSCGYSIYYFILLIIECYLLAPILVRYNNNRTLTIITAVTIVSVILMEYFRFFRGIEMPLIVRGSAPIMLIYFYLGVYFGKHSRNYSLVIPITMMVVGMAVGLVQMQWIETHSSIPGEGQKLSMYLFNAGAIIFFLSEKIENLFRENLLTRVILYFGDISFGIYFTHIYLIWLLDLQFPMLRHHWVGLWIASLVLTIVFIALVKCWFPKLAKTYLGYR